MENSTKSIRLMLTKIRDEELKGLEERVTLLSDSISSVNKEIEVLTKDIQSLETSKPNSVFEEVTLDARVADLKQQLEFKTNFLSFLQTLVNDLTQKYQVSEEEKNRIIESVSLDEMYADVKEQAANGNSVGDEMSQNDTQRSMEDINTAE